MENEKKSTKRVIDDVLTIEQTACYLKIHRSTVSRLVKSGELVAFQIGSRVLVLKKHLIEFIEKRIADGIRQSLGDN